MLLGNRIQTHCHQLIGFISVPMLGWLWINLYILTVGVLQRLIAPPLKEGRVIVGSKDWVKWRLNWIFYSYVFMFLSRYMLFNKYIRTIYLKLARVKLHYSSNLSLSVALQDANNLLEFDENSFLGSEVILAPHLIISEKLMFF